MSKFTMTPLHLLPFLLPLTVAALTLNTTGTQPWQIPRVFTHSPAGYPGGHPYSWVDFTVSDNSTILFGLTHWGSYAGFYPSATNCSIWWVHNELSYDDPRGQVRTCAPPNGGHSGVWSFEMLKGTEDYRLTTNLTLRIAREDTVILEQGGIVRARWEGEIRLLWSRDVEGNMQGGCGASGQCSFGLKDEDVPVLVHQRLVNVDCIWGDCEPVNGTAAGETAPGSAAGN